MPSRDAALTVHDRSRGGAELAAQILHGVVALVVSAALLLQLVLVIAYPEASAPDNLAVRVLRFFSFFTIQSNILVLVTSASLARNSARDGALWRVARLDALVAITVTGVVHYYALRPIQNLGGLDAVADVLLHVVSPIITVAVWLLSGPRPRVDGRTVVRSVVWPLCWFAYTLSHGAIAEWYPYPFVDVGELGYARTVVNAAVVTVVFLALAAAVRWADQALPAVPTSSTGVSREGRLSGPSPRVSGEPTSRPEVADGPARE